ncbi:cytochrome c, class I [Hydrogenivirga sp. 128-5-R1-1]|nr:cytochrome c, class I [Hydrogenivirga sp. 128-5-R1-1]
MKVGAVLVGAMMGAILLACDKKEEKTQESPKPETKEEIKREEKEPAVEKTGAYALADKKGCFACHDVYRKKVGPSYAEVAKRYAGKEKALEELVVSITKGSMGKWGSIPMTPQPVTKKEAEELAKWILSIK